VANIGTDTLQIHCYSCTPRPKGTEKTYKSYVCSI